MRHRKAGLKLGRTTSHRDAMFKNMVTALFKHDQVRTTDVKAKELRRLADKIITLAKRGDLHARRQALSIIREKDVAHKLFETASARFGAIDGGYTRIVKIGIRPGDAALVSVVSLYDVDARKEDGKAKTKKKTVTTSAKKEATAKKVATKKEKVTPLEEQAQVAEEKADALSEEIQEVEEAKDVPVEAEEVAAEEPVSETQEEDSAGEETSKEE